MAILKNQAASPHTRTAFLLGAAASGLCIALAIGMIALPSAAAQDLAPSGLTANAQLPRSAAPAAKQPAAAAEAQPRNPEYWRVTRQRSSVAMRHSPRTSAAAVGRIDSGVVVKNNGCQMNGDLRWCRVTRLDDSRAGWVQGRYLRESAAP